MKTWINTVQNCYASQEDLESYDEMYNVCYSADYIGENRVRQMWDDNKIIGGSVNPEDYGLASAEDIATILIPEYQESIEFTESDMNDMPEEGDFNYADITIEKIKIDIVAFINSIGMDQIQKIINHSGGDVFKIMFAHDFWLTRNGCGSGFWDSDCWGEFKDSLTEKAREMKVSDAYIGDDGFVYLT